MRVFFYGTLLDPDMVEVVMPHLAGRLRMVPARLANHQRVRAANATVPIAVPRRGTSIWGEVADGVDPLALRRMAAFEGPGYDLSSLIVRNHDRRPIACWAFLPNAASRATTDPWSLGRWQRAYKRRYLVIVRKWMREFGVDTLERAELPYRIRRDVEAAITLSRNQEPNETGSVRPAGAAGVVSTPRD